MSPYANHSGKAGITAFELGGDYLDIRFVDGSVYRYTYQSTGVSNIEKMKKLALAGRGLTTFINKTVRTQYALKLH